VLIGGESASRHILPLFIHNSQLGVSHNAIKT
jgi:hypothetical protein